MSDFSVTLTGAAAVLVARLPIGSFSIAGPMEQRVAVATGRRYAAGVQAPRPTVHAAAGRTDIKNTVMFDLAPKWEFPPRSHQLRY